MLSIKCVYSSILHIKCECHNNWTTNKYNSNVLLGKNYHLLENYRIFFKMSSTKCVSNLILLMKHEFHNN